MVRHVYLKCTEVTVHNEIPCVLSHGLMELKAHFQVQDNMY